MQTNWSIILNVVLLAGVIVAIFRVMRTRQKVASAPARAPSLGPQSSADHLPSDDIIAVRKVILESETADSLESLAINEPIISARDESPLVSKEPSTQASQTTIPPVMMFLSAKANRQLAGYELLQAVLAAGLRFGEGNLFHRHQHANGQGTILCSLAAATDEGVFDLQNIGAFTVKGLCLYMQPSGNSGIDAERFDIMLDTAKTLSEDLDTYLLDDRQKPLSEASIQRYHQQLNLIEEAVI